MTNTGMVQLTNVASRTEAEPLADYLEANGLRVFVRADDLGGTDPALAFVAGVSVQVAPADLEQARELLLAWSTGRLEEGWEDAATATRPRGG